MTFANVPYTGWYVKLFLLDGENFLSFVKLFDPLYMIRQISPAHAEMNIYFQTCVQTKQHECAGTHLIGMLFMLRVTGGLDAGGMMA